jgi:hypothetical protein
MFLRNFGKNSPLAKCSIPKVAEQINVPPIAQILYKYYIYMYMYIKDVSPTSSRTILPSSGRIQCQIVIGFRPGLLCSLMTVHVYREVRVAPRGQDIVSVASKDMGVQNAQQSEGSYILYTQ